MKILIISIFLEIQASVLKIPAASTAMDTEESDSMDQAQQRPVGINSSAESNIGV